MTLLGVQNVTLLIALAVLVGATRGRLGYDVPESDVVDTGFPAERDEGRE